MIGQLGTVSSLLRLFALLAAAVVLAAMCSAPCRAESADRDTITWPYFSYPPFVIIEDGQPTGGFYWELRALLWERMPGYEHLTIESPFPRSILSVEQGARYCFTGLLKRADREELLAYTLPVAAGGREVVVCRKGALDAYKRGGEVSLRRLLADPDLVLGYADGISYGPRVDALLEPVLGNGNVMVIRKLAPFGQQFKLVRAGRVDYVLSNSLQALHYDAHGQESGLEYVPVMEDDEPFTAYVACTRGKWGEAVVAELNRVIAELVLEPEYLEVFLSGMSPELHGQYRSDFERLVRAPARAYLGILDQ